jgi:hypothetical protein
VGVAKPIKIDRAFDDPLAIRRLVEQHGPYGSIGSYLPPSATRDTKDSGTPDTALPWFRATWAANGRALIDGAEAILHNRAFLDAASELFDNVHVTPNTVVVNVNAPMPAGAVHVDIPSFRGADRDRYPIRLLQAMGSSGLFEPWRVVEVGAVFWSYDGPGGAYDYWPEGLDGPMHSERPPFTNTALVADNDRMYHRIGWIGDPAAALPRISSAAEISHSDGGGWVITDSGRTRARYADAQIRISILWKAHRHLDPGIDDCVPPLTPGRIVEIFSADLKGRGLETGIGTSSLSDETWINLLHATYYTAVLAAG